MFQRSEKIGALVDAMASARKMFKPVLRRASNPYYNSKYAELSDQIEATEEGLSANQLNVFQFPEYDAEAGFVTITTLLAHVSDEWVSNDLRLPIAKGDAQGVGGAITYGKRYGYGAILSIASEADDDGNTASGLSQKDRGKSTTDKDMKKGRTINEAQLRALWAAFKKSGKTEEQFRVRLQAKYGIEHTKDILKTDLDDVIKWLVGPPPADLTEDLQMAVDAAKQRQPGEDDQEMASPPLNFK